MHEEITEMKANISKLEAMAKDLTDKENKVLN